MQGLAEFVDAFATTLSRFTPFAPPRCATSSTSPGHFDLPATIVQLQSQEVAYQAALGATAKVLQPSLMDFLR